MKKVKNCYWELVRIVNEKWKIIMRFGKNYEWKIEKLLLRTSNDCEWKKLHLLWGFGGEYERIANNILWKISWRIGKDYEILKIIYYGEFVRIVKK